MRLRLICPTLVVVGASAMFLAGCGDGPSKNEAPTGDAAKTDPSQEGLDPPKLPDPPKDVKNE